MWENLAFSGNILYKRTQMEFLKPFERLIELHLFIPIELEKKMHSNLISNTWILDDVY